jgi:predicted metal-dependent HD superfamily phosphohydrolase
MPSKYEDRLRPLWEESFRAIGIEPPMPAFAELVERYSEPQRAYHTLQHIAECFDRLDEVRDVPERAAIALALFFHDVIYDPTAGDNEEQSAAWGTRILDAAGASREIDAKVSALILATKHDRLPTGIVAQLAVDIDLSILGAERARYDEYEAQIRREYAFAPDKAFRPGRAAILRKFLGRPSIFSTVHFRERYEARARANLARSVADLSDS